MPFLSDKPDHRGRPIIKLYISVGTAETEQRDEPSPTLPLDAMIDTGAGLSQIKQGIIDALDLRIVGIEDVHTASTGDEPITLMAYLVNLSLAGDRPGPIAEDIQVIGSPFLGGLGVDMLLGRDVLDACILVYDGPNRRFSLAYNPPPSRDA